MTTAHAVAPGLLALKVGELVEVRSAEEIRATLDENGELAGLPFMPEMLAFCGRRLTVHKVAHKLCDYISQTGMRRMYDAVHLTESRCDGSAHAGCQNACSLYWKEQWLKRVDPGEPTPADAGCRTAHAPPAADGEDDEGAVRGRRTRITRARGPRCSGPRRQRLPLKELEPVPGGRRVGQRRRLGSAQVVPDRLLQPLPGPQQEISPVPADPGRAALGLPEGRRHQWPHPDRASSTSGPASSYGSSRVRRSWRRWTPT